MKIGVFDSGLGGLAITKSLILGLPEESFIYLGDTKRVPYGTRSPKTVAEFTCEGLDFLFGQGADAVVVACNTASTVLDDIQKSFPERKIWGVIEPTVKMAAKYQEVGIIATPTTIGSHAFANKLKALNPNCNIIERAAPLLVPVIENNEMEMLDTVLEKYLDGFNKVEALILGCTHYPLIRTQIEAKLPGVIIIDQTDIMPDFVRSQLITGEIEAHNHFFVTDLTDNFRFFAEKIFGHPVMLELAEIG